MELANQQDAKSSQFDLRVAREEDAQAILRLIRTSPLCHLHADWRLPVDWLGTPGFVVALEKQPGPSKAPSLVTRILGPKQGLRACLAVAADPPPASWVRIACIAETDDGRDLLHSMLAKILGPLKQAGSNTLFWLPAESWPRQWMHDLGFTIVNYIETYTKEKMCSPTVTAVDGLVIREAQLQDLQLLEEIESVAFDPLWRHSAASLQYALYQALSFDVAEIDGGVVGFQVSAHNRLEAHLVRLTVRPDLQGQGIGSALLGHAITGYRRQGMKQVTLNTQIDNTASQWLYKKFGFSASGNRLPVWQWQLP